MDTIGNTGQDSAPVQAPPPVVAAEVAPSPAVEKEKAHNSLRESLRGHLNGDAPKASQNTPLRESLRRNFKADTSEPVKATAVQAEAKPVVEPILAPGTMTAEEKAVFEKLDPVAQRYVARRAHETHVDYTRKTMEIAEREKALEGNGKKYQAFEETLAPVRDSYAKKGISEVDLVRRAIAWDQAFERNPIQAAREYLDSWGIDPSELAGAQPAAVQQESTSEPPQDIKEVVRQQLLEEKRIQDQITASERNANAVQSFVSSKPLFSDPGTATRLEAAMDPIVQGLIRSNPGASPAEILETAYNYVTKGDPQFSELIQRYEAKNQAERTKQDAIKAQNASRSVTGGPGSGSPITKYDNVRDNLRARLRE